MKAHFGKHNKDHLSLGWYLPPAHWAPSSLHQESWGSLWASWQWNRDYSHDSWLWPVCNAKMFGLYWTFKEEKGNWSPISFLWEDKQCLQFWGLFFKESYICICTHIHICYTYTHIYVTHTHSLIFGPPHLSDDVRVDLYTQVAWEKYICSVCKHTTHFGGKKCGIFTAILKLK